MISIDKIGMRKGSELPTLGNREMTVAENKYDCSSFVIQNQSIKPKASCRQKKSCELEEGDGNNSEVEVVGGRRDNPISSKHKTKFVIRKLLRKKQDSNSDLIDICHSKIGEKHQEKVASDARVRSDLIRPFSAKDKNKSRKKSFQMDAESVAEPSIEKRVLNIALKIRTNQHSSQHRHNAKESSEIGASTMAKPSLHSFARASQNVKSECDISKQWIESERLYLDDLAQKMSNVIEEEELKMQTQESPSDLALSAEREEIDGKIIKGFEYMNAPQGLLDREALDCFKHAQILMHKYPEATTPESEVFVLTRISEIHNRHGQLNMAFKCMEDALRVYERHQSEENTLRKLWMYLNLVDQSIKIGDTKTAVFFYSQSLSTLAKVRGLEESFTCALAIGIHRKIGRLMSTQHNERGVEHLTEAIDLIRNAYGKKNIMFADTLNELGEILLFNGKKSDALGAFVESNQIYADLKLKEDDIRVDRVRKNIFRCDPILLSNLIISDDSRSAASFEGFVESTNNCTFAFHTLGGCI